MIKELLEILIYSLKIHKEFHSWGQNFGKYLHNNIESLHLLFVQRFFTENKNKSALYCKVSTASKKVRKDVTR